MESVELVEKDLTAGRIVRLGQNPKRFVLLGTTVEDGICTVGYSSLDGKTGGAMEYDKSNPHTFNLSFYPAEGTLDEVTEINSLGLVLGSNLKVGTDPEVFAVTETGEVIPAFEFLPSKDKPVEVVNLMGNSSDAHSASIFYDGFQAEFVVPPGWCHGYMTDYVRAGLTGVLQEARKKVPTARLTIASALPISREMRFSVDSEHLALGCAPSKNVYGERQLRVPDPLELGWRFAGCHLHYGGVDPHMVEGMVKMMDAIAGVVNVAIAGEEYIVRERRKFYGRAGEFRYHPPKGVVCDRVSGQLEYRVPDTVILTHPAIFNFFCDTCRMAGRFGMRGLEFLWKAEEDETRGVINEGDVEGARKILRRNEKVMRVLVERMYTPINPKEFFALTMKLLQEGVAGVVRKPEDLESNWMMQAATPTSVEIQDALEKPLTPTKNFWFPEGYRRKFNTGVTWYSAVEHRISKGELL